MSEQWGKETAPQVPPSAKFRADLHRALEESHRQQVARRKVGAQSSGDPNASARQWAWFALLLLLMMAAAGMFLRRPQRPAAAS